MNRQLIASASSSRVRRISHVEAIGDDGAAYPVALTSFSAITLEPGCATSGCGSPLAYDFDLSHPSRNVIGCARYSNGIESRTVEGTAGIRTTVQQPPPRVVINEFRS